jgi:hypothetical protein
MSAHMTITLSRGLELVFDIFADEISLAWLERMRHRYSWPLDDSGRFYGFGSLEEQRLDAEQRLLEDISIINAYQLIIDREWTNIHDQDLLNYLHNVFERYHGLLDQQNTDWWLVAPLSVRLALARLNIDVHRAESLAAGACPRFVCTWYGQPKEKQFTLDQIAQNGRLYTDWGGVYLNYVEIGKTLEDLSYDDDRYIGDDAFQPFLHYSSDFVVRFYDRRPDLDRIAKYFFQHREFFQHRGIDSASHPLAMPYCFKVGQLRYGDREHLISLISQQQQITGITIHETSYPNNT